jgi:5-formyltetrahydrofolate cyclo-ligase
MRASLPDEDGQIGQSAEIREVLREWLLQREVKVIASFFALPGETLLLPLMVELPQFRWVLPRITGDGQMEFHHTDPGLNDIVTGPYGISEPTPDSPVCPLEEINLFLCPGIAFTPGGKRLGRGKGFYDRALAQADPESTRVGVCFSEQVHPELPTDPHDAAMHFLATPRGVSECIREAFAASAPARRGHEHRRVARGLAEHGRNSADVRSPFICISPCRRRPFICPVPSSSMPPAMEPPCGLVVRRIVEFVSTCLSLASGVYALLCALALFLMWMNLRLEVPSHAIIATLGFLSILACTLAARHLFYNSSPRKLGWFVPVAAVVAAFFESPSFLGVKGLYH